MASQTRERIVDVARDLIHGSSYAGVSVEDVCRGAGVNKGSLYHFFRSKGELGSAVLERSWSMMAGVLDASFDAAIPPLERIDRFVETFTAMMTTMSSRLGAVPGCPIGNFASEVTVHEAGMRAEVVDVLERYARYFVDAVREAQLRGDVDPALDPDVAGRAVVAYVQGLAVLAKAADDTAVIDRLRPSLRLLLPPPHA